MGIIIDRRFGIFPVDFGYENYNYISFSNIYPAIIVLIILRFLQIQNIYAILITLFILFYTIYTNMELYKKKVIFLNDIMNHKSYLEMDPKIIDFYYDNRWYIDYNLSAYRKSLVSTNNFLSIMYEMKEKLMLYPEQLYRNAFIEYKEALNNLHSAIYKMTSHHINNNIFNDNLKILKKILKSHLFDLKNNVIKKNYNDFDINIWSIINPSNIELEDDTKSINYSPHYSFF